MTTKAKTKKPSHEAFIVAGDGENAFCTKLGWVWPHDNGKCHSACNIAPL